MISNDIGFVKALNMTMASSLQARRNVSDLYTEDVFEFEEVRLDDECRNRNVEVLNIKLAAMGLEIRYRDAETGEIVEDV